MYRIKIECTRKVVGLTPRRWVEGGTDGKNEDGSYGYTPQIEESRMETFGVLEMAVDGLELSPVVQAILENSKQIEK